MTTTAADRNMGRYLRQRRHELGLTLQELARVIHAEGRLLARIERGERPVTTLSLWALVALACLLEPEAMAAAG